VDETFAAADGAPAGTKVVEVGSSRIANPNLAYALRIFGRPPRTTACDCERAAEPALPQTLFRMTDASILAKFNDQKGRVAALGKSKLSPEDLADELFLSTLSRFPRPEEKADTVKHLTEAKNRAAAVTDLVWALVNTREFILNH
jgi:hypothetical protein